MRLYLLDTNSASHVMRGDVPAIRERLVAMPVRSAAVSAVTQGELKYGLAKRGNPPALRRLIQAFLMRVQVLPWTGEVGDVYGALRASCAARGITLGALDMLIAAQAVAASAILVTRDKTFSHVGSELKVEDWSA